MKLSNFFKHVLAPLFLVFTSVVALAQQAPPTVAQVLGATGTTDKSIGVFYAVLGDFFLHPLNAFGGPSTLIGNMFVIFNGFIFLVGTLWASYGIVGGIVETAHSGEVLGKRLSAVWLPIRMVTGMSGIAPIFGGFNLSQVFIVTMSALGIGIANMMWAAAITSMSNFQTLIPPAAAMAPSSSTGSGAAAAGMFTMHVCDAARKDEISQSGGIDPYGMNLGGFNTGGDIVMYTAYGTADNPAQCGSATLRSVNVRGESAPLGSGFRVSSVNYALYQQMANTLATGAAAPAYTAMDAAMASAADRWYSAYKSAILPAEHGGVVGTPLPSYPQAAIDAAAANYSTAILGSITGMQQQQAAAGSTLGSALQTNMQKDGWFGAGAWFSTFAEANAAMADVMSSLSISTSSPDVSGRMTNFVGDALHALERSQNKVSEANAGSTSTTVGDAAGFAPINKALCSVLGLTSGTQTGNCSLGQAIVRKAMQASAIGSGGGGNGFFDDIGLVNPIIMFKNMGDYTMTVSSTIYSFMFLAEATGIAPDDSGKGGGSLMGAVASKLTSIPFGVGGVIKAIGAVGKMLSYVALPMLVVGMLMSIYIPMIPFITWMGGLVQYVVIVMQGMVGAPIAAMSHLDAEGEGLGRRTEAGYMFALNVTFRPALMLLGFFFASAIMIALGSFQANLFLMAMANAQGNSVTGLFSIVGFLGVFFVLNMTLIQGLFNMIFLLPDQVLSMIGSSGHMADLGKEVENKVHGFFIRGAGVGQGMAGNVSAGRAAAGRVSEVGKGAAQAESRVAGAIPPKGRG